MSKCYKFKAVKTIEAETYVIADSYNEARAKMNDSTFYFADDAEGVKGADLDEDAVSGAESKFPERISAEPAEAVLMSYWNKDKNAWEGFELFVKEVTNLYEFDEDYFEDICNVFICHDKWGKNNEHTMGVDLGHCHCKVEGVAGRYDHLLAEKGVCFTTAGEDAWERLGVQAEYPLKMGEVVYDETAENGCRKGIYKLERVMARPTNAMIDWLLDHPNVNWKLANY